LSRAFSKAPLRRLFPTPKTMKLTQIPIYEITGPQSLMAASLHYGDGDTVVRANFHKEKIDRIPREFRSPDSSPSFLAGKRGGQPRLPLRRVRAYNAPLTRSGRQARGPFPSPRRHTRGRIFLYTTGRGASPDSAPILVIRTSASTSNSHSFSCSAQSSSRPRMSSGQRFCVSRPSPAASQP